jgi:hypothetical protein
MGRGFNSRLSHSSSGTFRSSPTLANDVSIRIAKNPAEQLQNARGRSRIGGEECNEHTRYRKVLGNATSAYCETLHRPLVARPSSVPPSALLCNVYKHASPASGVYLGTTVTRKGCGASLSTVSLEQADTALCITLLACTSSCHPHCQYCRRPCSSVTNCDSPCILELPCGLCGASAAGPLFPLAGLVLSQIFG